MEKKAKQKEVILTHGNNIQPFTAAPQFSFSFKPVSISLNPISSLGRLLRVAENNSLCPLLKGI